MGAQKQRVSQQRRGYGARGSTSLCHHSKPHIMESPHFLANPCMLKPAVGSVPQYCSTVERRAMSPFLGLCNSLIFRVRYPYLMFRSTLTNTLLRFAHYTCYTPNTPCIHEMCPCSPANAACNYRTVSNRNSVDRYSTARLRGRPTPTRTVHCVHRDTRQVLCSTVLCRHLLTCNSRHLQFVLCQRVGPACDSLLLVTMKANEEQWDLRGNALLNSTW